MSTYRTGNHQPQNLYRDDTYVGVMFSPVDAAAVVRHMNMGLGECTCNSYEPCQGQCCGVGMCSCSPAPASPLETATGAELLDELRQRGELDDDADGVTLTARLDALRQELDSYTLEARRKDYHHD